MLKEWMFHILLDFIGENWSTFEYFCKSRGEGIADEIYEALGGTE